MKNGEDSSMEVNGSTSTNLDLDLLKDMQRLLRHEFVTFFKNIDAVLFDCDGVLWNGFKVLKNAPELTQKLRQLGKRVFFVTNNSTRTRCELLSKFNNLGFNATLDEIVGSAHLAALYLKEKNFNDKVYVVGSRGITQELDAVGIRSLPVGPDNIEDDGKQWLGSDHFKNLELDKEVKAVIVGFDQFFSYKKLLIASSYLKDKNISFIATNTDEQFPCERAEITIPGTGPIVRAVETGADRKPIIMGKPSSIMFDYIQRSYKIEPNRTLMIGDRGNTDILFGRNCNLWTLLVLSGVTSLEDVQSWNLTGNEEEKKCVPHFYLNEVGDLYDLLIQNGF